MKRFTIIIVATFAAAFLVMGVNASVALADTNLEAASSETGAAGELSNDLFIIGTCGTPDQPGAAFSANSEITPIEKFIPIEIPVNIDVVTINKLKNGDINHDGMVNIDDLLMVINAWGKQTKDKPSPADIAPKGGDLNVNFDDMLVVFINWGM